MGILVLAAGAAVGYSFGFIHGGKRPFRKSKWPAEFVEPWGLMSAILVAGPVTGIAYLALKVGGGIGLIGTIAIAGIAIGAMSLNPSDGTKAATFFTASAAAGALLLVAIGSSITAIYLTIFLVVLPLLNALHDWVSWAASRIFVGLIAKDVNPWKVAGKIAVDAMLALGFLFSLAFWLPPIVIALNAGFGQIGANAVDWVSFARAAHDTPFAAGLVVTGMLATTLIPTALHMVTGLTALVLRPMPGRVPIAGMLESGDAPSTGEKVVIVGWLMAAVLTASAMLVGFSWGLWHSAPLVGANVGHWLYATAMFWA